MRRAALPWLLLVPGLAAAPRGAPEPGPGPYDAFVPLRLGDSWSYDWRVSERGLPARTLSRTRTLEGTEFVGKDLAYRLVGDDGSYEAYSLVGGVLALHSLSERGRILSFDPPVVLLAPDMRPGDTRTTENAETRRRFRATLLGREDVETPLGRFQDCLAVRLETEGPEFYSDAHHDFFPGVGLVAFRYELKTPDRSGSLLSVDSRLRLARLSGVQVSRLADLAAVAEKERSDAGKDDASARGILRRAVERRYTWDDKFPGFKGRFEYAEAGRRPVSGGFQIDRDLNVHVSAPSDAARATLRNQISSFVSHRRHKPFDVEYAEAVFKRGATTAAGDVEVLAEGDTMGTRYLVRRNEILSVGRSVGRLRYETRNLGHVITEDGRSIVVDYELVYYSNEDQAPVSTERTLDSYEKLGGYWLPTGRQVTRSAPGKPDFSFELKLTGLQLGDGVASKN